MKLFNSAVFILRSICLGILIWLGFTRGDIIYWVFSAALLFFTFLDARRVITKSRMKIKK
ncbi:hypothetical protein [Bacillus toyonensis]|uniref:hypothetical protein n=1 Tax=Bacillus toyonensis TaxID=155322 RepID=UPI002E23BD53|nr:hypothetical protein [Bacillus toyonensis]